MDCSLVLLLVLLLFLRLPSLHGDLLVLSEYNSQTFTAHIHFHIHKQTPWLEPADSPLNWPVLQDNPTMLPFFCDLRDVCNLIIFKLLLNRLRILIELI